jgi:DNA repair protein RadC
LLRFAFGQKYGTPYFSARSELQNIPEADPKGSPSFSVSEKLARYGSSALFGVEHLTLLVGKESVALAEAEHARSEQLDNPESIYRACADMKLFSQEVLRVILLDTRYRHISTVEITKGSINESLAYPRDIFRPVIGQSAFVFVLVHNHPSGQPTPSETDIRLTRRLSEGARILQIDMLDHVIVGQSFEGRLGYFSFTAAGMI